MSTTVQERPAAPGTGNGGVPARRAVIRWAWRLFRREWRQQLLVLALITVAVAATFIGAAVATNTPGRPSAQFGTAQDLATFPGSDPQLAAEIASLQHRFGRTDVIENQVLQVPARPRPTTCGPRIPAARSAARCSRCSRGTTPPGRVRSR